jgi:hypothetical protein
LQAIGPYREAAMVRKAVWLGAWWACVLLAGCGGGDMSAQSPGSGADYSGGGVDSAPESAPAEPPAEAEEVTSAGAPQSDAASTAQHVQLSGAIAGAPGVGGSRGAPPPPAPVAKAGRGDKSFESKKDASSNRFAQNTAQPQPVSTPASQTKPKEREQRADVEAVAQPMLVYTATLTMAVFEVKKSLGDVDALARELGGFLARRTDTQISIRVPVARFDDAIARLEKMGDVVTRNVTAEDVTEEFFDLEVRLKSSRAVRDRLEQLLQKAIKVEDSVLIERELTRVVGEIERIEGRMKFLRDRASYSTITVDFRARGSERVGSGPFNLPVPWLSELGLRRLLNL